MRGVSSCRYQFSAFFILFLIGKTLTLCRGISIENRGCMLRLLGVSLTLLVLAGAARGDTDNQKAIENEALLPECPVDMPVNCFESDRLGFEAIRALHSLIDDDMNGNVDPDESDEFLRDELQYSDGNDRHSIFHGRNKLINVDDLWLSWKRSEVFNWTIDDVISWLSLHVELPQYSEILTNHHVNGSVLPRLAANLNHFLSTQLGIKNVVHKQKFAVKAMDAVLFGVPKKPHNYVKDVILVTVLVLAVSGFWFAYVQHQHSQQHIKKMMKELDSLQNAEDTLGEMQERLERAEQEQIEARKEKLSLEDKYRDEIVETKKQAKRLKLVREGSSEEMRLTLAEKDLEQAQVALQNAEDKLSKGMYGIAPELQAWLQLTYEIEHTHYITKKRTAEKQLQFTRDECARLRKKRNSVLGSLRIAQSSSMDDIDARIASARAALEDVRNDLQERLHRWASLEHICAFPIVQNSGLSTLCNSMQREITAIGTVIISAGANRDVGPISPTGASPVNLDDVDEDQPPSYAMATDPHPVQRLAHGSSHSLIPKRSFVQPTMDNPAVAARPSTLASHQSIPRSDTSDSGSLAGTSSPHSPVTFDLENSMPRERSVINGYIDKNNVTHPVQNGGIRTESNPHMIPQSANCNKAHEALLPRRKYPLNKSLSSGNFSPILQRITDEISASELPQSAGAVMEQQPRRHKFLSCMQRERSLINGHIDNDNVTHLQNGRTRAESNPPVISQSANRNNSQEAVVPQRKYPMSKSLSSGNFSSILQSINDESSASEVAKSAGAVMEQQAKRPLIKTQINSQSSDELNSVNTEEQKKPKKKHLFPKFYKKEKSSS